ncbi:MAG: hypothetical protein M1831_002807 [Alyxoria varia]|nr:MAG: hypothetical protein M1831_002807 [Alyxoria varia]
MDWSSTEPPVPPVPDSAKTSVTPEPPARTESMTHRGRYSYASSPFGGNTNSPRRVRRRKDPTPFNVLVVGTQACGKTAFIEFLRKALYRPTRTRPGTPASSQQQTPPHQEGNTLFTPQYVETEYDGERIGLTIYDSKGLDTKIIDLQLRELSRFVESKFQDTFFEERKVLRAPGAKDTHIHCVFMILEPARLDFNVAATGPHAHDSQFNKVKVVGALDERVDVELLRVLQGKTTVIPVISKADTITTAHMSFLKRTVSDSLKKLKIDPLEALNLDSDEEEDTEYDTASSAQHSDVDEAEGRAVVNAREDEVNDKDVINNLADPSESKTESSAKGDSIRDIEVSKDKAKASQGQESKRTKVPTELDPPHLPLSIISPDMYDPGTVGRRFPWGFADPYNADHCDFVRLKDNVFGEWRTELQEAARDRWYEGWRTSRLDRAKKSLSPRSSQQRAVSNAAAYGGKSLESTLSQQPTNGSSGSRTVSASNIGVAISNTGGGPPLPKTNYRGVGTY